MQFEMFDQIEAALSLWDRLRKWHGSRHESHQESLAGRVLRVFESHGVHRNQIPRFVGNGLNLHDVHDDATLLAKIDEQLMETICERFAIRREWLDGAEKQVHPTHRFYKHPRDFASFLTNLRAINPDGELRGVVVAPSDREGSASALLLLEEQIGWIGERPIYRYHLCDDWPFSYWKARAYLTACVAVAWKHGIYVHGCKARSKDIDLLASGEILMGWDGEGLGAIGHRQWDPEDMALRPDRFLKGIDPERQHFGVRSALHLWLELHGDGFMDTGLSMYEAEEIGARFESELKKQGKG